MEKSFTNSCLYKTSQNSPQKPHTTAQFDRARGGDLLVHNLSIFHIVETVLQLSCKVLCHNPPLPGLPDHTLFLSWNTIKPITTQNQLGALVHSNSSMIQLLYCMTYTVTLLYDVITSLANFIGARTFDSCSQYMNNTLKKTYCLAFYIYIQ